jgi:DNA helicase-2/ATP-dependent DNA helicase PcrA
MAPREILILLSNRRLEAPISVALAAVGVSHELASPDAFVNTPAGRVALALLRVVCDRDDYVAHRTLLGCIPGVGIGTCQQIAAKAIQDNLNFRDMFYRLAPMGGFSVRQGKALEQVADPCAEVTGWNTDDRLADRSAAIELLLVRFIGEDAAGIWGDVTASLPDGMTLREVRDFLWADRDEQQADLLRLVYARLEETEPEEGVLPARVRIMTMHGAKGLGAQVVFVPGLEAGFLPNRWQGSYAGLVLEAARLLYVSLSRARMAAVVSYADRRTVFGQWQRQVPSPFAGDLGMPFRPRSSGLSVGEAEAVVGQCALL